MRKQNETMSKSLVMRFEFETLDEVRSVDFSLQKLPLSSMLVELLRLLAIVLLIDTVGDDL